MNSSSLNNRKSRPLLTLVTACLAVMILPASLTGTSVAIPHINAELQPGLVELQWVINAYNLTFACFMLTCGSLADILGRKRVFIVGTVVFAVCSLASTLTSDILLLDIARGVSGIGAAAMMTAGSALLANTFDGKQLATAFAFFGSSGGAGLAIGPSVSGFLVGSFGWRAVFSLHLVVSIVILALVLFVPAGVRTPSQARIDWGGTLTFTPALFAFVLGIVEGPQLGWTHPLVIALGVATLVIGALFVLVERRTAHPMFDFALFRSPRFLALCLIPVSMAFSFVALLIYLPIYFTATYGMTPGTVGWVMAIMTVPVFVAPLIAGRFLARGASVRWMLAISLLLVAVGSALLTMIEPGKQVITLVPALLLIGVGQGWSLGILDGAAVSSVPPARAGTAAGMFNTSRLTGETIGIVVIGTVLVGLVQSGLFSLLPPAASINETANQVLSGNIVGPAAGDPTLIATLGEVFSNALHIALWGMSIVSAMTAAVTLVLMRERKEELLGEPSKNLPAAQVVA